MSGCRAVGWFLLSAATLAGPAAVAAQYETASVSAETTCRAAPWHSEDAVGMFEVGDLVLVHGGAGTSDGQWMRVASSLPGGYGFPDGCWVPLTDMVLARGTGHFLQLADGLLSATAWPTLDELLAAHNLFGQPRYRDEVEASAVLTERRGHLLARAVEAAQRPRLGGRRPADDDPLILAWLESLGEQVTYSEDRRGNGWWTMAVAAREREAEPSQSRPIERATRPDGREMAIIAPDVACRSRPSRTAYYHANALPLDFHFRAERPDTIVAGDAWVHVGLWGCWVLREHTAPGESEEHVVTIADRFLTSGEGWSSDNRLRMYNVLSSWNRGHREEVEASPALGLARLRVLGVALADLRPRAAGVRAKAWTASLGNEIRLAQEGHAWAVSDEAYLNLYEKHRSDPFAEDIMWAFASESAGRDCEGGFACSVNEAVINRLARYWTDFPGGRHIAEAVEKARSLIGHGLESCQAAHGTRTDSPDAGMWRWSGWDRSGAEITRELRATLEAVSDQEKAPLLEALAELEACAA